MSLRGRVGKLEKRRAVECPECGSRVIVSEADWKPYTVAMDPEWWEVRTKLIVALEKHPEARDAVLAALKEPGTESDAS